MNAPLRLSSRAEAFEHWIRTSFVQMNTELENLYFANSDRSQVIGCGDSIKGSLRDEGHAHVVALLAEGNTGEGFDSAFGVLGSVGLYLGALRRHELTNPAREERSPFPEASSLALHVGASLGMAPRFSTGHLATHNKARAGVRKSFTSLPDEFLFIDENTRGILALQRAADALTGIVHLGVSSPVADVLFDTAKQALRDVMRFNDRLMSQLDVERFFYSVRPYYKPYRVGRQEYRGANAGDFSGINELDLLLGLCRANDPYYAQLLVDKMLFMLPVDQARLRDCMTRTSLLDELLALVDEYAGTDWFQQNARAFLEICDLFGQAAAQHHDGLVRRFIEAPAATLSEQGLAGITASGPPLPVLLRSLEVLRDLRLAADRSDIVTRHADLDRLRSAVVGSGPAHGSPKRRSR
ncbi:MAG TPA: monodechloroaminopyrrolnitrin synthase PrnB family protein [Steroidobacteraceae bacterium]|nr:monodechloroaminopyrrolnitrin synthase PrnB family protein [Steroidobacteraceae bacterium]